MGILAGGLRILNEKVEFVLSSRLGYGSETKKYLKVLGANTFFFDSVAFAPKPRRVIVIG